MDESILARGMGIAISGKLLGRGLNFLAQALLARYLGPDVFGLFAIGWAILRLISMITPLGLDQGILQFGSKHWRFNENEFRFVFRFSTGIALISGILIGLLLYWASDWMAVTFFRKPDLSYVLRVFSASIPFVTGLRVFAGSTTILKTTKFAILSEELFQPLLEVIIIGVVIYFGWGLRGSVWAVLISIAMAFFVIVAITMKLFPEVYYGKSKVSIPLELITFSIPIAFASLFGSLISWIDRVMVGYFLNERQTGIYTTVSLISILFVTILSGVKIIVAPLVARMFHQGEIMRLQEIYRISTKWGLYLSIPLSLICYFSASDILSLFGMEYLSGYLPLLILVTAQLFNVGTGALDMMLTMTGNQQRWLQLSAIALVLNVSLNILLIPRYGITGAALGTGITLAGTFVYGLFQIKKMLNIWPYDRRFIKGVIAAGVTAAGLFLIHNLSIDSSIIKFCIISIISFTFFGLVLFIQGFDNEDWMIVQILRKLPLLNNLKNGR